MPEIHLTLVGTVIAFSFIIVVASLLHWMLNPSKNVKMTLAAVGQEWTGTGAIVVPVRGSNLSEKVLELAAGIAQREQRHLLLLYVVEIPMALPPDVELPEERERGEEILVHLEGAAQKLGVQVEGQLVKARTAGAAIVRAALDHQARMIIVSSREQPRPDVSFGRTVEHIYRYAPCDVMVYRPAVQPAK